MTYDWLALKAQRLSSSGLPKVASSPAKAGTPSVQTAPSLRSQSDAVAAAIAGERAKIAAVFRSAASRGRERTAADIVTAPGSTASAGDIIALLNGLPTDQEFERRRAADRNARAGAMWDKAYADIAQGGN